MNSRYSIKRSLFLAAAGAASVALLPNLWAAQPDASSTNSPAYHSAEVANAPQLPAGFIQKDEDAASGVKSTLVGLTNRAVTKNSYNSFFSSFLSELDKRDKARAQEFTGVNQDQLNATITQIQNGWRSKYNQDFDVSDKNLVFNADYPIVEGEVSDPNTAASSMWPLPATTSEPSMSSASSAQRDINNKELTKGRAVAVICFPGGEGLPAIRVSMIHQLLTGWYVEIPADRTGEQIYTDLSSQLSYIASHQNEWPSDVTDGYRMVARHVVAALYGVTQQPGGTANAQ